MSYSDYIVGAAVFDLSGLPKEYFTTGESNDMSGTDYHAVVVRQPARYVALLLRSDEMGTIPDGFMEWSFDFDPSVLRIHPNFSAV